MNRFFYFCFFKKNSRHFSRLFHKALDGEFKDVFHEVVFAILPASGDRDTDNITAFEQEFGIKSEHLVGTEGLQLHEDDDGADNGGAAE